MFFCVALISYWVPRVHNEVGKRQVNFACYTAVNVSCSMQQSLGSVGELCRQNT